jgi:hypothetical protein
MVRSLAEKLTNEIDGVQVCAKVVDVSPRQKHFSCPLNPRIANPGVVAFLGKSEVQVPPCDSELPPQPASRRDALWIPAMT